MEKDEQELSELENEETNDGAIQDSSELNNELLEDSSYQSTTNSTSNIPIDTINNSVNSFKNNYKNNKETINRLNEARNKGRLNKKGISTNDEQTSNENVQKDILEKEKQAQNIKRSVKTQTALQSAASTKKTKDMSDKAIKLVNMAKKKKTYIAIGVAGGFILFIVILCAIFMNDADESYTSARTNNYITGNSTDEELIDYMSYIAICPGLNEIRQYAEKYEIDISEGITFDTVRELAGQEDLEVTQTCLNALDYYEAFKAEYVANKEACKDKYGNTLGDYWLHTDPEASYGANPKAQRYFDISDYKDKPDCQVKIPTELIFETMSYDLQDQELFNKEYFTRENYPEYSIDLRKLSEASSEFMHETCYKWMWESDEGDWFYYKCDKCHSDPVKKEHDGWYFQVSFDKYVCFLKYGDTCEHPNYNHEPREKFPDLAYLEHECGSPENDHFDMVCDDRKEEKPKLIFLGDSMTVSFCRDDFFSPPTYEKVADQLGLEYEVALKEWDAVGATIEQILEHNPSTDSSNVYIIWTNSNFNGQHGTDVNTVTNGVVNKIKEGIINKGIDKYIVVGTQNSKETKSAFNDTYTEINRILADNFGDHFLDINDIVVAGPLSSNDWGSDWCSDRIHFSDSGYTKVADAIANKIREMGYDSGSSGGTRRINKNEKLSKLFPDGIPTTAEEMQKYLTTIQVKILDENGNDSTMSLTVHKDLVENFKGAFEGLYSAGFRIKASQTGAWRDTNVEGTDYKSQHFYGVAVDINTNDNPVCYTLDVPCPAGAANKYDPENNRFSISSDVAAIIESHELLWGMWDSKRDYMHFSYTGA